MQVSFSFRFLEIISISFKLGVNNEKSHMQENSTSERINCLLVLLPFDSVVPSFTPIYLPARPFKVPVSWPSPLSVILPALLNNRRKNTGQGQGKRRASITFPFNSAPLLFIFYLSPLLFSAVLIFTEECLASLIGDNNSV